MIPLPSDNRTVGDEYIIKEERYLRYLRICNAQLNTLRLLVSLSDNW